MPQQPEAVDAGMKGSGMSNQPWLFASAEDEPIELVNPTHPNLEKQRYNSSNATDVDNAIGAAVVAGEQWRSTPALARGKMLASIADSLRESSERLAASMTEELGKPHADGIGEVQNAAAVFDYYSALLITQSTSVKQAVSSTDQLLTLRAPLGVVAAITPWNFPINIASVKGAPALAFGNTVVLKPSPLATATTQLFLEVVYATGLPTGVLSLVQGDGPRVPEQLIRDPRTAAVSFTGSTRVGRQVLALAAENKTKVQCEMGGKNPAVVLADADLPSAVKLIVDGAYRFAGQRCTATSRVIVEEPVYDEFRRLLVEATEAVEVGDPATSSALVGPLVNAASIEFVGQAVKQAVSEGGKVLAGGESARTDALPGYFYRPTIIETDLKSTAALTEIFGPVITLHKVIDFDAAIAATNATEYGLCAAINTSNLDSALRFADEAEVGAVAVNGTTAGWQYQAAFGGWKDSGAGAPEQGPEAELFFTRQKTVRISRASGL